VQVLSKTKSSIRVVHPRSGSLRSSSTYLSAVWVACLLFAVVYVTGCGITYNTLPLTVNPSSLSFGAVQIGKTQTAAVTLQNQGLSSVTLSGVQVADPAFKLSSAQTATTIPAGGTANVQVTFAPTEAKDYSSQIMVMSGNKQTAVSVSGTGQQVTTTTPPPVSVSPALKVSATTLQFGSVPIGGDAQQSLTLTSSGTGPLEINALNANGGAFSAQMPSLPLTLQPGQTLTLPVKFGPKTSGAETGQLIIASDAVETPSVTVALMGSGAQSTPPPPSGTPALTLSSSAVNFGSVTVGSQASNSVTLTSSGTAAVVLQSLQVSGGGFSVGHLPLPVTLAPGQQIALPFTFAPSNAGVAQGQVSLVDNATGSPRAISLSGTGTAPTGATSASLSAPANVDFGDVTVDSQGSKTITLVSNGTGPVTVNSIAVAGASFSDSPQVLPQVLQPGQQMSLKLKFSPTAEGNAGGTVTVSSNATTSPTITIKTQGNGVAASAPALSASASSLSFGEVPLGSQRTKTITVTSTGTAPATISGANVTGASYSATYAGVAVQNLSAPITLQPGQQITFSVAFDPTATGTASGQLSLATDTGSPVNVSLTGSGVQDTSPALTVSAPNLDFGDVQVGSTAVLQLTLTSSGTAPVTISSSTIAGQAFQISSVAYPAGVNSWPVTLNPGQQVVLSITFAPDAANSFAGDLALASNASGGTANIPLAGTGNAVPTPNLSLSATSISFGQTQIGSKISRSLTLTSTGNAPLDINTITVSGAAFSIGTQSLPVTLQPNQQLTLTVTFDPTTEGPDAGTLTVTSNDGSGPATVSLGGDGRTTAAPQLTVTPTTVDFGSVPLNVASAQSVTLTSTGTAPVIISAATVNGAPFSISGGTFPMTLAPNQTATLQVQFDPTAAGPSSGQLTVASNSTTGATTKIQLAGTGTVTATPQLTVSTNSLSFGNVTVGSSATLPVTLTSSGTAPVTISAAALGGTGFTDSGATFPLTLNPNQTVTLQVKFGPTTAGGATGQLTITSTSSTGGPAVIQLSGTGTAATSTTPQLLFSSTALSFGNVPVGSTATLSLTLTSSGTAAVTISSAVLQGTGFSDSGAKFPMTLNPNQSVTITLQFDPTAAGAATGMLTVSSNSATGGTTQVMLSGTATATVQYEVDLSWNAPSSSADPVAGYNVYRSADGGSFTRMNASPDDQVSYSDPAVQSGSTYIYQVTSVDSNGVESSPSNQFTLTLP
jgi:Abnormal spindle-like microcephaly-assoc'd, ASPM-SPD-2-Hydin